MVMDTLGLAICVALTYGVRKSHKGRVALPLIMFPFLATMDLLCIFKELKATHLRSLNQERTEILAEKWLQSGIALSPKEVQYSRTLLLSFLNAFRVGEVSMPCAAACIETVAHRNLLAATCTKQMSVKP